MLFERKMTLVKTLCNETTDVYDCDGCLWPGVEVSPGDYETARNTFDAHRCSDYINSGSFRNR
jgi:hypothetical protein